MMRRRASAAAARSTTIAAGHPCYGMAWLLVLLLLLLVGSYDGGNFNVMILRPVQGYPMILEVPESDERVSRRRVIDHITIL
jgi:hypothetical protein